MRYRNRSRRLLASVVAGLAVAGLFAAAAAAKSKPASPAVVATDSGAVRGEVDATMRSFLGIPYAAAPVGPLRWKPPQPVARWQGVRSALQFGSGCPQAASLFGHLSTNENCLFLNVYTPPEATAAARLPVMVWIHGGAFITGESNDYDPTALVKQGVLVVTLNYRLGLLGFLAHPALAAESGTGSSGDYGLMDQQAALRWVQRNIARFGGDPKNVTIFGESAGGLSVRSLLVSPAAKGLFAKAIVESGAYTVLPLQTEAQAEAAGEAIAAKLGCPDQTASCLRNVPVQTLLNVEAATTTSQLPNLNSAVLPEDYATAFASGAFNRVPVLEGSNHDEWGLFEALDGDLQGSPVTAANYQSSIQSELGVSASQAAGFAALYPPSAYPSAALALRALGTDLVFACGARLDVRSLSHYVTTYQYEFADPSPPNVFFPVPLSFPLGAYHASELQYLWPTRASQLDAAQQQLALTMRRYWTNFAKTGDPNGAGLPTWPQYAAATDEALSLVPPTPTTLSTFATEHRCSIWTPGA